jgi:hypothetical protein
MPYAECCYADARYAECRYSNCLGALFHDHIKSTKIPVMFKTENFLNHSIFLIRKVKKRKKRKKRIKHQILFIIILDWT